LEDFPGLPGLGPADPEAKRGFGWGARWVERDEVGIGGAKTNRVGVVDFLLWMARGSR